MEGDMLLADTGDIVHMEGGDPITVFKTPGNFAMTDALRSFLRDKVEKLFALGFRSGAIDIEFMRIKGDLERYELVEINPRYSFMGFIRKQFPSVQLSGNAVEEEKHPIE